MYGVHGVWVYALCHLVIASRCLLSPACAGGDGRVGGELEKAR